MMNWWAALVAFVAATLLVPVSRALLLKWAIVDVPNERSSHAAPTPRGGGLAVGVAALLGLAFGATDSQAAVLGIASLALGVVGFVEDCVELQVRTRLAVQTMVASAAVTLIVLDGYDLSVPPVLFVAGAVVGMVGLVNAFNFMDGINGMSAAQAIVGGLALVVVGSLYEIDILQVGGVVIAGAFLGFLPYNVPTARVFLGDVGSYFTGCWLAILIVIAVDSAIPPEVVIAPFLVYFVDTTLTLGLRARSGEQIGEAHSDHAYQRLARAWGSHSAVAAVSAVVMAIDAAIMIGVRHGEPRLRAAAFALAFSIATLFVLAGRRSEGVTR